MKNLTRGYRTRENSTPMDSENDKKYISKLFLSVLESRRRGKVPLSVREIRKISNSAFLQREVSVTEKNLDKTFQDDRNPEEIGLEEEHLILTTEEGSQGQVPMIIIHPKNPICTQTKNNDNNNKNNKRTKKKRPVVIFLHSTGRSKEMMRPHMEAYALRGYLSLAIDSRYHGERASSPSAYQEALVEAWRTGEEMPFIFDTVWDLTKVLDYLEEREDTDLNRIGITGVSLGGMHAWLTAVADSRIFVTVPLIGVQNFRWAVESDSWQARVESIPYVFQAARVDLGKETVDSETVEKVWKRIAPGLMDEFNSNFSLASIAPRPLLILNGADDPRCPIEGLKGCVSRAAQKYLEAGFPDRYKFVSFENVGHATTEEMERLQSQFMDRFLDP